MKGRNILIKQILVTIVFIGLLAIPLILSQKNKKSEEPVAFTEISKEGLKNFGFYFEEVSEVSGLEFRHSPPILDPAIDHILAQIASTGAAVSVTDYNNDGWNDLYFTSSRFDTDNALYRNNKDGTFTDISAEANLVGLNKKGIGVSMGAVWADYDNDGFEDLFLYRWGKPSLFKNINGEKFEEVSNQAGMPEWLNTNNAIWFDYNADGFIDLFIGGYYREDIDLWNLASTNIMQESFEYANNGGRNFLFKNKGDGSFVDVAEAVGLTSTRWTLASGAIDINKDGFTDLFIANDYGVDELYLNIEGKHFEDSGKGSGIGFSPKSGMNIAFGDVTNSGSFSFYVSNITENGILLQGNNLWVPNQENGKVKFVNQARIRGIEDGGWSYGSQFGDINNDGSVDLYLANGYISGKKGTTYWYDYSKVTGGNSAIISDIKNWPSMEGRSQSGYQRNRVWLNDGNGTYFDVASEINDNATLDSRSIVMADLWNRGVLDVIVANQDNNVLLYKNHVSEENHWIEFKLEGSESNKSAIGAVLNLYWDGKVQAKIIDGGIGFCSQNQRRVHFGLGTFENVEKVVIKWPSGKVQEMLNPEINRIHIIKES